MGNGQWFIIAVFLALFIVIAGTFANVQRRREEDAMYRMQRIADEVTDVVDAMHNVSFAAHTTSRTIYELSDILEQIAWRCAADDTI